MVQPPETPPAVVKPVELQARSPAAFPPKEQERTREGSLMAQGHAPPAWALILGAVFLLVLVWKYCQYWSADLFGSTKRLLIAPVVFGLIYWVFKSNAEKAVSVTGFIYLCFHFCSRCPACRYCSYLRTGGGSLGERIETRYKDITQQHYDRTGNFIGKTVSREPRQVRVEDSFSIYRCNRCDHEWARSSTTEL